MESPDVVIPRFVAGLSTMHEMAGSVWDALAEGREDSKLFEVALYLSEYDRGHRSEAEVRQILSGFYQYG